jgi:hypothetical protein
MMEIAYDAAIDWGYINVLELDSEPEPEAKRSPVLIDLQKKSKSDSTQKKTTTDESDEDLDFIVQKLYAINMAQIKCWNYQDHGHFAKDCKKRTRDDYSVKFGSSRAHKSRKGKNAKETLNHYCGL